MDSACVGLYTPVLEEAQYHLLATQIIFCSGYTLLLYDWILTLAREYRLIWPIRWGPVKYLYLFCRYYPIITLPFTLFSYTRNHDLSFCTSTFRIPVALATWNQLGAEAILLARTAAFWCNRRWVVGLLLASLSTVIAYQIWVIFVPMKLLPFFIPPFTKGPCLPFDEGAHIMGFFIAPFIFDTFVTALMFFRLWVLKSEVGEYSSSPLMQIFVSEGLWYFVLVSAGNLLNGAFYLQSKKSMSAVLIPFSIMIPDILACRLILDLRQQGNSEDYATWVTDQFRSRNDPNGQRLPQHRSKSNLFQFVVPTFLIGRYRARKPNPGPSKACSTIVFDQRALESNTRRIDIERTELSDLSDPSASSSSKIVETSLDSDLCTGKKSVRLEEEIECLDDEKSRSDPNP